MPNSKRTLSSEEDVRTKVVVPWLVAQGFTPESISVEHSFEIRLGRGVYRVDSGKPINSSRIRPRADVLVRSHDNRNLLIFEVKAPHEPLDEDAKEQGISYARMLRGGIAPFVVITNGRESQIYDSITEDLIQDTYPLVNHPHAQNGFRANADDMGLYAQALETFVSLSSENLLAFCQVQVAERMQLLRGDDPFSGQKYIPELYIEREQSRSRLHQLLNDEQCSTVILVGAPQVGKTNFVCRRVEEKLENNQPCLFYPAINMGGGLLKEISDDFCWILQENKPYSQLIRKLAQILQRTNQRLVIFIDGWNEANRELAKTIDRESERLSSNAIQIVVSFTNLSSRRLLLDDRGNPSYIARATSVSVPTIELLEISPEQVGEDKRLVLIRDYTCEEVDKAYDIYSKTYNVVVPPTHTKVSDPFLIRVGMQFLPNRCLPDFFDEPALLQKNLKEKILRTGLNDKDELIWLLLERIGQEMLNNDAPIKQAVIREWNLSIAQDLPQGLFEAALLVKVNNNQNLRAIDFYYGRERDYIIACSSCDWGDKIAPSKHQSIPQLLNSICTNAGIEALSWFFKQPSFVANLKFAASHFPNLEKTSIKRIILSSLRLNQGVQSLRERSWLKDVINWGANDGNLLVRVETAKLMTQVLETGYSLRDFFETEEELEALIVNLLSSEDHTFLSEGASEIVLEALSELHIDLSSPEDGTEVPEILTNLMDHPEADIRYGAAEALAYLEPEDFLGILSSQITLGKLDVETGEEYFPAIEQALRSLHEGYFGTYCPGKIDYLREYPDEHAEDYENMCGLFTPIIDFYKTHKCEGLLRKFLEKIAPEQN